MKMCSNCEVEKPESEFHVRKASPDGLAYCCKPCVSKYDATVPKNTPEHRAANARYRKNHYEKDRQAKQKWTQNNSEKILLRNKLRYAKDLSHRLKIMLRARVGAALRNKSDSTLNLLGCPIVWLEIHLASLFKSGMTWETQGKVWHIDHVRPCASFNLTDPEQQRECFHWGNLQPLFASENYKKSDNLLAPPPYTPYSQTTCDPHIFKAF